MGRIDSNILNKKGGETFREENAREIETNFSLQKSRETAQGNQHLSNANVNEQFFYEHAREMQRRSQSDSVAEIREASNNAVRFIRNLLFENAIR